MKRKKTKKEESMNQRVVFKKIRQIDKLYKLTNG